MKVYIETPESQKAQLNIESIYSMDSRSVWVFASKDTYTPGTMLELTKSKLVHAVNDHGDRWFVCISADLVKNIL